MKSLKNLLVYKHLGELEIMWQLDWDDAFNNFVNIENPNILIDEWRERSSSFKNNSSTIGHMELDVPYSDHSREKYLSLIHI